MKKGWARELEGCANGGRALEGDETERFEWGR